MKDMDSSLCRLAMWLHPRYKGAVTKDATFYQLHEMVSTCGTMLEIV